jgi:hypothetical protein
MQVAVGAHGLWKVRLRAAIDKGTGTFTVATVAADHECDFGKFLFTTVAPEVRNSPHWRKCRDLHARFHREASSVLQLALAGKKEAAEQAMDSESEFARLSRSLIAAMLKWRSTAT